MTIGKTEILRRIGLINLPVTETLGKIDEEDMQAWIQFFDNYAAGTLDVSKDVSVRLSPTYAHMFALGYEYHRFYGDLWGKPQIRLNEPEIKEE